MSRHNFEIFIHYLVWLAQQQWFYLFDIKISEQNCFYILSVDVRKQKQIGEKNCG